MGSSNETKIKIPGNSEKEYGTEKTVYGAGKINTKDCVERTGGYENEEIVRNCDFWGAAAVNDLAKVVELAGEEYDGVKKEGKGDVAALNAEDNQKAIRALLQPIFSNEKGESLESVIETKNYMCLNVLYNLKPKGF